MAHRTIRANFRMLNNVSSVYIFAIVHNLFTALTLRESKFHLHALWR